MATYYELSAQAAAELRLIIDQDHTDLDVARWASSGDPSWRHGRAYTTEAIGESLVLVVAEGAPAPAAPGCRRLSDNTLRRLDRKALRRAS